MEKRNLSLLTDLYELTMMQGYFLSHLSEQEVVFDFFYRKNPDGNGYAVFAGLEQLIAYVQGLRFTEDDIEFLKSTSLFCEKFLEYLRNFRFQGSIQAVEEGRVVFPQEPLVIVKGRLVETQILESALLNILNHQSLIATKAARIKTSAKQDPVFDFGLRRAQGPDAALYGARASFIGGMDATSNVLASKMFQIPLKGTMAHSWVMSFDDEYEAFEEFAKLYPNHCFLLVDTYNTLQSGLVNATALFHQLKKKNQLKNPYGIRLDSGDLAYLSKEARKMLDKEGFSDAIISASGDLDEYLIEDLKKQEAKITNWGVGTKLITSYDTPSFGGVYKLTAAKGDAGDFQPKIKLSENVDKVTTPGYKKVLRFYDKKTKKIKADYICLQHEKVFTDKDYLLFDPKAPWKKMLLKKNHFYMEEMLHDVFVDGRLVYKLPQLSEMQKKCKKDLQALWEEYKRFKNPHIMPVDLSLSLYQLKEELIFQLRQSEE